MSTDCTENLPGQRGPVDHERREQILEVAEELFGAHGFRKTSVTDIGKAVGVSSAYIYRFFDSKQAIGEAVCAMCLAKIDVAIREVAERDAPATKRLRAMLQCPVAQAFKVFLRERRLHDIIVAAIAKEWQGPEAHAPAICVVVPSMLFE